jgi:hypothetical protein
MSYQKFSKYALVFGILHLINSLLGVIQAIIFRQLMFLGDIQLYSIISLIFFGIMTLIRFSGNIVLLAGLIQITGQKKDNHLKWLLILLIIMMVTNALSWLVSIFAFPLLYSYLGFHLSTVNIILFALSLIFCIPSMIFAVVFLMWGLKMKNNYPSLNIVGFYLVILLEIGGILIKFVGLIPLNLFSYIAMYGGGMVSMCFFIAWIVAIMPLGNLKETNEPEFNSYSSQDEWTPKYTLESSKMKAIPDSATYCNFCGKKQDTSSGKFCQACGKPM